jgi:hypothetical protein
MATAGAYSSDSYALDFLPSITNNNNYDTSYPSGTTSSAGATSIPTTQAVHGMGVTTTSTVPAHAPNLAISSRTHQIVPSGAATTHDPVVVAS